MKFSNYAHLKLWEGCKLVAYKDVGGVWTIGYGSTGPHVFPGLIITQAQADAYLDADLARFEQSINSKVKVSINQNQYDALVSLAYNIGVAGFERSTVLRRLNSGDYDGAADAMLMWNKVNGKIVKGLVNRREAERKLFLTPVEATDAAAIKEANIEALIREYTNKLREII